MAFTKTPTESVYQSKTIPLVYKWDQRGGTPVYDFDSRMVNAIPEIAKDPVNPEFYNAYKRDGCTHIKWRNATPPQPEHDDWVDPVRGIHTNTAANEVVVLNWSGVSSTIYIGLLGGAFSDYTLDVPFIGTNPIPPGNGQYNFTDFVYDNGNIVTVYGAPGNSTFGMAKHTTGYTVSSIATGVATNGDPVALDGYVFASSPDGSIWNSNLNDPTVWSASNFITAESYGDRLVRIARCGSYILAFGTNSIEWFYDAANPTGSPLSVYPGATRRIGYVGGLAYAGDDLYFVGKNEDGAVAIYKASGLKVEKITDFFISRELYQLYTNTAFNGNFITLNGHALYVISATNPGITQSTTIYYDLETKFFGQLSFKQDYNFRIYQVASLRVDGANGVESVNMFCMAGDSFVDTFRVYAYSPWFAQDDGVNYTVTLQTSNQDFDTWRNKFASRVVIHADRPLGATSSSNCTLSWYINDYRSPVLPFRTINLNDDFPVSSSLGQFRKIAFKLDYTDRYPCRFSSLELDYVIGGS